MKILSIEQIRSADDFTIKNEPISSIDLMERAATFTFDYIFNNYDPHNKFIIFCGPGNNGGDGYVIARKFYYLNADVHVVAINLNNKLSTDCEINYKRLEKLNSKIINNYSDNFDLDSLVKDYPEHKVIIIDAIFGSGLSKSLNDEYAKLINWINGNNFTRISIDISSGLFGDKSSKKNDWIVKAHEVITFQTPKLALFLPENFDFANRFKIIDIELDKNYIESLPTENFMIDEDFIKPILKRRKKFEHKGNFGHSAIVAGNYGTMGASVLASKACMRVGAGLLTSFIPDFGYNILQISVPEVMVNTNDFQTVSFDSYNAIGIGPGLGTDYNSVNKVSCVIDYCYSSQTQLIIDADGLNILAQNKSLLDKLPENSILTPHPKEFQRLFGEFSNDFERLEAQKKISKEKSVFIVYKQAHTIITDTDGNAYFNSTGNPGMATGGSGDVLTGIITGLCSRGYNALESCVLGVYLHGLAGDIATHSIHQEALIASDIIENLPVAFKELYLKRV
ncbi:NAD(P)H-hydrate dehydratase [Bacteroidales bacterium OttesenSCG-928-K03]|nr:NAD(P)H-hydrate dehydratase [Bacteroidales bacterium OttesenSCG-928-K03]